MGATAPIDFEKSLIAPIDFDEKPITPCSNILKINRKIAKAYTVAFKP